MKKKKKKMKVTHVYKHEISRYSCLKRVFCGGTMSKQMIRPEEVVLFVGKFALASFAAPSTKMMMMAGQD